MDPGKTGIIPLRRLVKDLRRNFFLFTRENYVCFDGLPYDYEAVLSKDMIERVGKGLFWVEKAGPGAYDTSRMAHEQFDKLSGVDAAHRRRQDRLPDSLLKTIENWLDDSEADALKDWSHSYLAHASDPGFRKHIAAGWVTADKITSAIKAMSRVTEVVSAYILFNGGRSRSLMPIAQFNQFKDLDKPIMESGGEKAACKIWDELSDERNSFLDGVEADLIKLNVKLI